MGSAGLKERNRPNRSWRKVIHEELTEINKTLTKVKQLSTNRVRWQCLIDALVPIVNIVRVSKLKYHRESFTIHRYKNYNLICLELSSRHDCKLAYSMKK